MFDFSVYQQEEPQVYAYKCPNCGKLYYPAPMICNKCSTRRDPSGVIFSSWEKVPLKGKCRLLGWTRVYALPEGFDVKYLLFGIVEFENGLRASGRLMVDNPKTGMELTAKVGVVKEKIGEDIYGFMFYEP
ncbi:MAG: DNA-binding protein [Spirochaetales bacterium]|nr:DNA-binding protein [Spirochaetales bacterium]